MTKYSRNAEEKIAEVKQELKFGKGGMGGKVKPRKQAIVIPISEAKKRV